MVLLVTDGKQSTVIDRNEKGPVEVSEDMQRRGIEIHAMGVAQADPIELLDYVSDASFARYVENFDELDSKVAERAASLCPRKLLQRKMNECIVAGMDTKRPQT